MQQNPTKDDFKMAKKALKYYIDKETEIGVHSHIIGNRRVDLNARILAIYMACAREIPTWSNGLPASPRRIALRSIVKDRVDEMLEKCSQNSKEWFQKVKKNMPSEKEIEHMVNDLQMITDPNEIMLYLKQQHDEQQRKNISSSSIK
jgi:hypothetical protein